MSSTLSNKQVEIINKYRDNLLKTSESGWTCKQCKGTGLLNFKFIEGFPGGDWDCRSYCKRCFGYGILDDEKMESFGFKSDKFNFEIIKWINLRE